MGFALEPRLLQMVSSLRRISTFQPLVLDSARGYDWSTELQQGSKVP